MMLAIACYIRCHDDQYYERTIGMCQNCDMLCNYGIEDGNSLNDCLNLCPKYGLNGHVKAATDKPSTPSHSSISPEPNPRASSSASSDGRTTNILVGILVAVIVVGLILFIAWRFSLRKKLKSSRQSSAESVELAEFQLENGRVDPEDGEGAQMLDPVYRSTPPETPELDSLRSVEVWPESEEFFRNFNLGGNGAQRNGQAGSEDTPETSMMRFDTPQVVMPPLPKSKAAAIKILEADIGRGIHTINEMEEHFVHVVVGPSDDSWDVPTVYKHLQQAGYRFEELRVERVPNLNFTYKTDQ